jgi:ribosome-binding factor A
LTYALADSVDAVLRDVSIVSVTPAPDASRLLVTVAGPSSASAGHDDAGADLLARLDSARGYLRSEVAASIHRKRAPELAFSLAKTGLDHGA